MTDHAARFSPQRYARAGGVLYLIIIVTGIFGEAFVRNGMIVSGDATATLANIAASPHLWRLGIALDLLMHICDIPLTLIFYVLLKPVNRNLALLVVLFALTQTAVLVACKVSLLLPLFLIDDVAYLKVFDPGQLAALGYLAIKIDSYGFGIGLMFFGCECLVLGRLIFTSGFLPRFIGVLMPIAGLCYLTNSFALILSPALAGALFPAVLVPAFIAESSFCLWLLFKGVDVARWETRAARSNG